ncbi:MAG: Rieske 2Fe-2S domain-containing protein [Candidatus Sulfopaludibacter sp.]|nr:Rieske 2Fe-2S domain-containing protein [Candidatus Sulfopaludibacter sp.]
MSWFRKPSSTPLWRDEFPVFTADERYVNRRQFTKFLTLTSFGMLAGNLWILARSAFHRAPTYPRIAVAAAGEIAVGGVKTFAYPTAGDPCILVRTGSDSFAAYSQKCTHLSCAVYYDQTQNRLECPCHQGFFSIADGSVLQGPPRRALPRVSLERKDGQLIAVGVEGEGS